MFSDFFKKINADEIKNMLQNADLDKVQQKLSQMDQNDINDLINKVGADNIQEILKSDTRAEIEDMLDEYPEIKDKINQMMRESNFK